MGVERAKSLILPFLLLVIRRKPFFEWSFPDNPQQ